MYREKPKQNATRGGASQRGGFRPKQQISQDKAERSEPSWRNAGFKTASQVKQSLEELEKERHEEPQYQPKN